MKSPYCHLPLHPPSPRVICWKQTLPYGVGGLRAAGAVLLLGNLLSQDPGESRGGGQGRSQHSPVRGGVTGFSSRLERFSARRSLGRVLCNPLLPGGPRTHPGGMDLESQGRGLLLRTEPAASSKLQAGCSRQRLRSAELSMFLQLF